MALIFAQTNSFGADGGLQNRIEFDHKQYCHLNTLIRYVKMTGVRVCAARALSYTRISHPH